MKAFKFSQLSVLFFAIGCFFTFQKAEAQCDVSNWIEQYISYSPSGDGCVCTADLFLKTATGEFVVFIDALEECNASDYPDSYFDCEGNLICFTNGLSPEWCTPNFTSDLVFIQTIYTCSDNPNGQNLVDATDDYVTSTSSYNAFDVLQNDEVEIGSNNLVGNTWYLTNISGGFAGIDSVYTNLSSLHFGVDGGLAIDFEGSECIVDYILQDSDSIFMGSGADGCETFDTYFQSVNQFAIEGNSIFMWADQMSDGFMFELNRLPGIVTVEITNPPIFGTASVNTNGTINYSPNSSGQGDFFVYQICETITGAPQAQCDQATVFINGGGNQETIYAGDDFIELQTLDADTFNVFANDSSLSIGFELVEFSEAEGGTLDYLGDGVFEYTAGVDFVNFDFFLYTICDAAGNCASAEVFLSYSDVPPECAEPYIFPSLISVYGTEDIEQSSMWAVYCFDDFLNTNEDGNIESYIWDVFYYDTAVSEITYEPFLCDVEIPIRVNAENTTAPVEVCLTIIETNGCTNTACTSLENPLNSSQSFDSYVDAVMNTSTSIWPSVSASVADWYVGTGQTEPFFSIMGSPEFGTVVQLEDNTACDALFCDYFDYTPNADFTGQDAFSYQFCFNDHCDTAFVYINVVDSIFNCNFSAEVQAIIVGSIGTDDVPMSYGANYYCFEELNTADLTMGYNYNWTLQKNGDLINEWNESSWCDVEIPYIENAQPVTDTYTVCVEVLEIMTGCLETMCLDLTNNDNPTTNDSAFADVWAGDANADGYASNFDVLSIGLGYYLEGESRPNATIEWEAQAAPAWNEAIFAAIAEDSLGTPVGDLAYVDGKHADCNGDGVVNVDDMDAISLNYGLSHGKTDAEFSEAAATAPFLRIQIEGDTLIAGSTVTADLILENENGQPVTDVYGLAFSIDYENDVDGTPLVVENTMEMTFEESWLGNSFNTISLSKDFATEARVEAAFTRIDHQHLTGAGKIATISFVIEENVAGKVAAYFPLKINVENSIIVNANGEMQALNNISQTVDVVTTSVLPNPTPQEFGIDIAPNPASTQFSIVAHEVILGSYQLFDISGKMVKNITRINNNRINNNRININVNDLPNGLYILQITDEAGQRIQRKIEVMH